MTPIIHNKICLITFLYKDGHTPHLAHVLCVSFQPLCLKVTSTTLVADKNANPFIRVRIVFVLC